jgi:hypothetical protein
MQNVRITYKVEGTTDLIEYEAPYITIQLHKDKSSIIKLRKSPSEKPYRIIMFAYTEIIDRSDIMPG